MHWTTVFCIATDSITTQFRELTDKISNGDKMQNWAFEIGDWGLGIQDWGLRKKTEIGWNRLEYTKKKIGWNRLE